MSKCVSQSAGGLRSPRPLPAPTLRDRPRGNQEGSTQSREANGSAFPGGCSSRTELLWRKTPGCPPRWAVLLPVWVGARTWGTRAAVARGGLGITLIPWCWAGRAAQGPHRPGLLAPAARLPLGLAAPPLGPGGQGAAPITWLSIRDPERPLSGHCHPWAAAGKKRGRRLKRPPAPGVLSCL